jgi:hypothetical protein
VGNLLRIAYEQNLVADTDVSIEKALLDIPSAQIILRYEKPEAVRNRLLMCIPVSALKSAELKRLAAELSQATDVRENKPYHQSHFGVVSPDEWLRLEGIDPAEPENARVLELVKPLEAFELKFVNGTPSKEECAAIEPQIRSLYVLASELLPEHKLADRARGVLCAVAKVVLKNHNVDSSLVKLCRKITFAGASDPVPAFDPEYHLKFDSPSWGGGQPRIEAAQGLSHILWNWGPDDEVVGMLKKLSQDEVPAVRLQVASGLLGLYKHQATGAFWDLMEPMMQRETTSGVTLALVETLGRVVAQEPQRVVALLQVAIQRAEAATDRSELRAALLDILVWLYVVQNETSARVQIFAFVADPIKFHSFIAQSVFRAANYLHPEKNEPDVRARARELLQATLAATYVCLSVLEPNLRNEENRESFHNLLRIVDDVAFRIYSTLGVNPSLKGVVTLDASEQRELYFELKPLIDLLSFRSASPGQHFLMPHTAHLLLQTLDVVLAYDPLPVVRFAAAVCRASAHLDYQFDQMAVADVVRFVEHVLADHKDILRNPTTAKDLGETLDIFIRAGWPEVMRLVFTMDQAVR